MTTFERSRPRHRMIHVWSGLVCVLLLGCGFFSRGEALVRLDSDAVRESFGATRPGEWSTTLVKLSAAHRIRKVVIVPKRTLTRLEVQVRQPDGNWFSVRELNGRYASNITVRMDLVGDAVRIIEKVPALRRERGAYVGGTDPTIETVLLFGTRLAP